jgi:hypothetical protein
MTRPVTARARADVDEAPVIIATPAPSAAAQVAKAVNPENPQAEVNKALLQSVGMRTEGWTGDAKYFWKQHSTQVWLLVAGIETTCSTLHDFIPKDWALIAHAVAAVGSVAGIILRYRVQLSIAFQQVHDQIKRLG